MGEFRAWADRLARPSSILIVSAHWQTAPMAISATQRVPLVYDFYGFPESYYRMTYDAPGAPELAAKVRALMPPTEPVLERPPGDSTTARGSPSRRCTRTRTSRSSSCRCR